jgi:hypothetical protein
MRQGLWRSSRQVIMYGDVGFAAPEVLRFLLERL